MKRETDFNKGRNNSQWDDLDARGISEAQASERMSKIQSCRRHFDNILHHAPDPHMHQPVFEHAIIL